MCQKPATVPSARKTNNNAGAVFNHESSCQPIAALTPTAPTNSPSARMPWLIARLVEPSTGVSVAAFSGA